MLSPPAPEAGRWRTTRVPYLREIMDACADPAVERIVLMKSAGLGFTEGVIGNLIGYHIHLEPAALLVMQPTGDDAKGWSKENLEPLLRDTPPLQGKVIESGRRDAKNTLRLKLFPGGYLAILGSNSAAGLRRRRARVLIADEVDGYGATAKGKHQEGDPLSLAMKRLEGYWNRKIVEGSTPTIKNASRIEADYELSDQRLYFVPCPHCGQMQTLKWPNLRYEERDGEVLDVHFVCGVIGKDGEITEGCGQAIGEEHKAAMIERGEWRAQRPGRSVRGYRIWAAYSLLGTWRRIVQEWIEAQRDVLKLQVFVNTVLGETWEEKGETVDGQGLQARREHYPAGVATDVGVLTAGVDVQGDRLEVTVWGYGLNEQWVLGHEVLWGDPGQAKVWEALDAHLWQDRVREDGLPIPLSCVAVDSGGHHTDRVYRYCRARQGKRVFAVKGMSEAGKAPVGKAVKVKGGTTLFPLGTEALKDTIYSWLRADVAEPGFLHLPDTVSGEWIEQLTSEVARVRYVNKRAVRRYEKIPGRRNEALDCAVYALAALIISGQREKIGAILDRFRLEVEKRAAPKAEKPAVNVVAQIVKARGAIRKPGGGWVNSWK